MSSPTPWPPRSLSSPPSCAAPSPGITARRWPSTPASASRPECPSTSAIHAALGSAAPTRTPTGSCASTSPSAATCAPTPKPTSTPSPPSSTTGLDKPSDGSHHHKHSTKRCDDLLRPHPFWCVAAQLSRSRGAVPVVYPRDRTCSDRCRPTRLPHLGERLGRTALDGSDEPT